MRHPLLLTVRNLRQSILTRAQAGQPIPTDFPKRLLEVIPQLTRTELDDRQLALLWGELQFILIESEGAGGESTLWGQMRNAADAALVGLLKRKEWSGLAEVFRQDLYPRLAAAVTAPREQRIQACIEATTRLRALADLPMSRMQRWLLLQIAEMQFPRFGTSGWRARMGVDFTWRRATAVAQAIVEFVKESGYGQLPLSIGYDSRINADKVAMLVADVAIANGIDVHLAARETPSPALIYYITEVLGVANNAGLINCTPSHNPVKDPDLKAYVGTEYHGIRYNMPYGAVAPTRATDMIGRRAMALLLDERIVPDDVARRGAVTYFDPMEAYITAAVRDLATPVTLPDGNASTAVTQLRRFWGADNAMIVIDEMHSASRGYLRGICSRLGLHEHYTVIHGEKDPLLGELLYANPEPPHIDRCAQTVRELSAQYPRIIGIGFDTDSDRFGVVDEHGQYVMTNQMLPMLAHYLLTAAYNGKPGLVIRNMVTTRLLDRVASAHAGQIIPPPDPRAIVPHAAARSYQVVLGDAQAQSGFLTHVVPVGFKYIADVMMKGLQTALETGMNDPKRIQQLFADGLQQLLIAGEESNGMTSRGHTPDKDGLWAALLTLQMCAVCEKPLDELWNDFVAQYGRLVSARRDVQAPDVAKEALVNTYLDRYAAIAGQGPAPDALLAHFTPVYCGGVRGDLVEVILYDADNQECYLTIRASGTEPLNRIYVECPTPEQRDAIMQAVGEELERQILQAIAKAPDVTTIVDLLESVALPPDNGDDLPATYTERILAPAIARMSELAGNSAKEILQQADRDLSQRNAAKAKRFATMIGGQ